MWKTRDVVMLPTNKKAKDIPFEVGITSCNDNKLRIGNPVGISESRQNLYITSDEEIKENDYCFDLQNKSFRQNNGNRNELSLWKLNPQRFKKIIATTDDLNKISQIPQQFIQYYIEEYNKGNVIIKVLVEYDFADHDLALFRDEITLKVNPDNTINIKPIKDSWSREEVRQLCYQAFIYHKVDIDEKIIPSDAIGLIEPFKEWCIKNNL